MFSNHDIQLCAGAEGSQRRQGVVVHVKTGYTVPNTPDNGAFFHVRI